MTNEHIQILEGVSFDGPLSPWHAIAFASVLAAIAFWSLFRVPGDARGKLTPVLWLLRIVAIAILGWMLLGPVRVVTQRHVSPKTLAVVRDVSGSMNVVDPPDKKNDLHWQAAEVTNPASSLLSACDSALTACALGREQLNGILRSSPHAADPERECRKLETAARAVECAAAQMPTISRLVGEVLAPSGSEFASRAQEVASILSASRLEQAGSLMDQDALGRRRVNPNALSQIEQWHRELGRATRQLADLTDRLTDQLAGPVPAGMPSEPMARREKVDRLLKAGDATWLAGHEENASIRHYAFDLETVVVSVGTQSAAPERGPAAPSTPPSTGKKRAAFTNLSSALERVSRDAADANTAAVILLSDGRHNDPAAADPRTVAKTLSDLPVYVVPVGTGRMPRDIVLHHVESPVAVVEGDQLAVEAIVSAYDCAGEKCTVELSDGNSVIARETLEIGSIRRDFRVRLATKSKGVGKHEYSLRATGVRGEAVATNNAASFSVDVIDATLKILVADDVPRWEHRYLIRLFERDKKVQFDEVLFQPTANARGAQGRAQLPQDVDGWAQYRLAILGDLSPSELDSKSQQALKEYVVDRGGTLVLIAGPQSMPQAFAGTPLADLAPVTAAESFDSSQGYSIALSAEGRLNAAMQLADEPGETDQIWKELSDQLPVYTLSTFCVPKPAARTLLRAYRSSDDPGKDDKAFVCWQTVGRGRVVYIASPTVYQLRLKHGDRYHHRFWGQLVRWAVARDLAQGSKTVKLTTDRTRATVDENVQVVANLSGLDGRPVLNAHVQAQISAGDTALALVDLNPDPKIPGRYLGEFSPSEEGLVTVQVSGADVTQLLVSEGLSKPISTTLVVDPGKSVETEDTRSNAPLLSQIARLTGGQVISPAAIPQVIELTDLSPRVRDESTRTPIWDRWPLLWLFCGVLVVEWVLRKSTGLP
jgi:hypothetical protein